VLLEGPAASRPKAGAFTDAIMGPAREVTWTRREPTGLTCG
jgi:hypothetical protein